MKKLQIKDELISCDKFIKNTRELIQASDQLADEAGDLYQECMELNCLRNDEEMNKKWKRLIKINDCLEEVSDILESKVIEDNKILVENWLNTITHIFETRNQKTKHVGKCYCGF